MTKIKWYNLNEQGNIIENDLIIRPLLTKPSIYVYKFIYEEEKLYIGSTINMIQRFRQHRYRAEMHGTKLIYNTKFYNYIAKYGWPYFKFGVIKYIDLDVNLKWQIKKEILLQEEQYYLDKYYPSLNINKTAGSMKGYKHKDYNNKLEFINKEEFYVKNNNILYKKPSITQETILKLKLHNKDITVSIYNKENVLIKEFNRIKKTAKFVGLSSSSVSGYIKSGKLWNNLYYFKLKSNTVIDKNITSFPLKQNIQTVELNHIIYKGNSYPIKVFKDDNLIYHFNSIRQASLFLNISKITLMKYSKENKLWNNEFKFIISY